MWGQPHAGTTVAAVATVAADSGDAVSEARLALNSTPSCVHTSLYGIAATINSARRRPAAWFRRVGPACEALYVAARPSSQVLSLMWRSCFFAPAAALDRWVDCFER